MKVTVYCASSAAAHAEFAAAAYELGRILARAGHVTVYGGGAIGSMGRLADGALDHGGRVIGIMPRFMGELEWGHPRLTEIAWTETMSERKERLFGEADAVVALPGGTGTLEELIEVLTLKRLGLFLNPVVIVNQRGFYDPLVQLLLSCVDEAFMSPRHLDMWRVVDHVDQVLPAIAASPAWTAGAREFAVQRTPDR
jgi:uncharacterized protein (TIGR00730 family)